jgi:hypothetical protein
MSTTRRAPALAALVGAAALLAGCSGAVDGIAAPEPYTAPSTTVAPEPATSTAAATDPIAACRGFFGDGGDNELMWRVPNTLTSLTPQLDDAAVRELAAISDEIDALIAVASGKVANALRTMQLPFRQAADALDSGGGPINLDTGVVRTAMPDLIEACNDVGFDMNG